MAYFHQTFGYLWLIFFQPWAVEGLFSISFWLSGSLGLFTVECISTLDGLRQISFQPFAVCSRISANPKFSAVDFLPTLRCLRLIFFESCVVYGGFSINHGLSAVDFLSALGRLG